MMQAFSLVYILPQDKPKELEETTAAMTDTSQEPEIYD